MRPETKTLTIQYDKMGYERPSRHYIGNAVIRTFNKFFQSETSSGIILLICAALAIICANNSSLAPYYNSFFSKELGIGLEGVFDFKMSIEEWINDGLMAVFFLVVGLEIKREMLVGQLSSVKKATLPIIAALGGMLFPAMIYAIFNHAAPTANGWGIPMATDIAFAIGILSILGNRVPLGLKVFLTALAIADDLGSIVVIALFYPSHKIEFVFLALAAAVTLFMAIMNRLRINKAAVYVIPGIVLWYFMLRSGVHATIAGVIMAITIPAKSIINEVEYSYNLDSLTSHFKQFSNNSASILTNPEEQATIHSIGVITQKINPLLHRFEERLHPWSNFFIMPLFAFANAGVVFDASLFSLPIEPIVPGIFFGLLLGKPLGIFLTSWVAVKTGIAVMPKGSTWIQLFSLGIVAGIGFTMAIFVDGLAFLPSGMPEEMIQNYINLGKAIILITSCCAAIFGLVALMLTSKQKN